MIEYPFQLRPDLVVTLWLPKDLKRSEIARLCTFMEALLAEEGERSGSGT
jgi:hypothetical protein